MICLNTFQSFFSKFVVFTHMLHFSMNWQRDVCVVALLFVDHAQYLHPSSWLLKTTLAHDRLTLRSTSPKTVVGHFSPFICGGMVAIEQVSTCKGAMSTHQEQLTVKPRTGPSRCRTSRQGQLSLAIPQWVGSVSTGTCSRSCGVKRHTTRCASPCPWSRSVRWCLAED